MNAMHATLGAFRAALVSGWILLTVAGFGYARLLDIPAMVAAPVIAAFLLEYLFYLVPGFETVRSRLLARFTRRRLALGCAVSGLAPYLLYSLTTGEFRALALLALAAPVAAMSFWYIRLGRRPLADLGFLVLAAAPFLVRPFFERVYTAPMEEVETAVLGRLMWIRLAAFAALALRGIHETGFGFLPSRRDWKIGALHFAGFLPIGFALAWALGFAGPGLRPLMPWKIAATFIGALWVVALAEEFFFRGLLQEWLARWMRSPVAALVVASALFGLVHLGFRAFPNWRFALLAGVAGLFYGRAYRAAGSIRASMVTHALVVTTWRAVLG
ncbi:MAG: CPBP family intramembrane metalloprotease [Acidobacteria bacterium]|nr:CPBP family intramembrane metalloprotease [Acidobacteriota bacterium]